MNLKKAVWRSQFIYAFLFVVMVGISSISYYAINNSSKLFTDYREMAVDSNLAKNLLNNLMYLRLSVKNFIQYGDKASAKSFYENISKVDNYIAKAEDSIQNSERVRLLTESKALFREYKAKFEGLEKASIERAKLVKDLESEHLKVLETFDSEDLKSFSYRSQLKASYFVFFLDLKKKIQGKEKFSNKSLLVFKKDLYFLNKLNKPEINVIGDIAQAMSQEVFLIKENATKTNRLVVDGLDKIGPQIVGKLKRISTSIEKVQDRLGPELVRVNLWSKKTILYVSVVALLIALISVFVVIKSLKDLSASIFSLSKDLHKNTETINTISEKTAVSSNRVAESSHEQAASLEETSSSLEEMDGMTRKNLDSVKATNDLTETMKEISDQANSNMQELVRSMDEITKSNHKIEELSSVISDIERKTRLIDEIVSQTKILSFNASVEAEKAGEHGKGFAVVAEEVGSLAKSSGEAAKEIQDIVAATLKEVDQIISINKEKVDQGSNITDKTNQILVNISKTCSDVLFKNQEVFNATDEQVQGIKQINIAVSELDQATQENSSVAQETTAVAENLKEQSSKLSDIVESLNTLLGISSEKKKDKKVRQDQSGSANVFSFAQAKRDSTRKDTLNEEKQTEFEEVPEKLSKVSNDPWDQI